jgi:predicted SnoaL-like aldol condensation-catalyzing enzyme
MRTVLLLIVGLLSGAVVYAGEIEEGNKALARRFYEEVWFRRNVAAVDELVAPTYIVHDVGERKNAMEAADEQKKIAEFFWDRGTMTGSIDYQIAEGDLVATRWQWHFKPDVWWMKALGGDEHIPIINVFRFRDGKIVEIWNHRHDIDTGMGTFIFVKGLALGLVPAAALLVLVILLWRKLRKLRRAAPEPAAQ